MSAENSFDFDSLVNRLEKKVNEFERCLAPDSTENSYINCLQIEAALPYNAKKVVSTKIMDLLEELLKKYCAWSFEKNDQIKCCRTNP